MDIQKDIPTIHIDEGCQNMYGYISRLSSNLKCCISFTQDSGNRVFFYPYMKEISTGANTHTHTHTHAHTHIHTHFSSLLARKPCVMLT
jgi:hypothetical protein